MRKLLSLLLALLCLMPGTQARAETDRPEELLVHQIMVGCADAYLLQYGDVSLVIDGGLNDETTPELVLTYLRAAGVEHLTAYFASHYHLDHVGNMNTILAAVGDGNTLVYGPSETMTKSLLPLGAGRYRQLLDGDVLHYGALTVKCVGPERVEGEGRINKDSLNLLVTLGKRSFLFTGDYVRSKAIIDHHREEVAQVDVFKFPHHGIKNFCVDGWALKMSFLFTGDYVRSKAIIDHHREEVAQVDVFKFPHHGIKNFCVDGWALKIIAPRHILLPGAKTWEVRRFCRQNGLSPEIYDNGDGNVVVRTDGETLEFLTQVTPEQLMAGL